MHCRFLLSAPNPQAFSNYTPNTFSLHEIHQKQENMPNQYRIAQLKNTMQ